MTNKIIGGIAVLALIFSIIGLVGGNQSESNLGGGTRFQNGISADNISPNAGEVRGTTFTSTGDVVLGGGTLNVTTSNTATSTLVVGCVQFYATSTATAQRFQASTTPGAMYSAYGSCPNL